MVGVALIGVGCGSSEESSSLSTSSSPPSKAVFVKQVTTGCEQAVGGFLERVNIYTKKHESDGLPEGVFRAKVYKAVVVPTVEAQSAAVQQLPPPTGDKKQIEALLAAQQAVVDRIKKMKTVDSPEGVEKDLADVERKFAAYGIASCGHP